MPDDPDQPAVEVRVEDGGARARLRIPVGADPAELTQDAIVGLCRERGLLIGRALEQRVRAAIEASHAGDDQVDVTIAEAVPPVHGRDGGLAWEAGFEPGSADLKLRVSEDGTVDHYNAVERTTAQEGDHLATIVDATPGEDGHDVKGRNIAATPGREVHFTVDEESVRVEKRCLYAMHPGLVELDDGEVRISPVLEIPTSVDFSTGNIDFAGSVHVHGNVSDRFVVHARDSVTVDGVVEAATIICGSDFTCRRGMAAKEHGELVVEGNARSGYLHHVRGRVRGDLIVRGELMDSRLVVGGRVLARRAAVVGGLLAVTGAMEVGTLGSNGGAPTTLILGEVPLLAAQLHRLERLRQAYQARLEGDAAPRDAGQAGHDGTDPSLQPGAKEAELTPGELRERLDACDDKRRELLTSIRLGREVALSIERIVHPRVCLRICGEEFTFRDEMRGPLWVGLDRRGDAVFRRGRNDEPQPLFDIARRAA